ncbi:MAG: DUF3307 domain-containing protein [Candidatus Omnitrophica bacterium]|nr:DUF3307 domain-containing protein [Candidatus Omnitrophota bacterium]
MFVFLKLSLAHLIGDFVLQFEELYELKLRSARGNIIHVLIHAVLALVLLAPYLGSISILGFIGFISIVHFVQDSLKYGSGKDRRSFFPIFVLDQLSHFFFMSFVFVLPASKIVRGFADHAFLNSIYISQEITIYLIAFIAATFCGAYLFNAFYLSYGPPGETKKFISSFELAHGLIERGMIVTWIIFMPNGFYLLPLLGIGLLRLPSKRLKCFREYLVSVLYACLVGVMARAIVG